MVCHPFIYFQVFWVLGIFYGRVKEA